MKIIWCLLSLCFSAISFTQTWQTTSIPGNINGQRYDDVFFLNENLGWAANGFYAQVFKTTDGGDTWKEQLNESILGSDHYFRNIEFLNENTGFLGSLNGKFYKTDNGGDTWQLISSINPNPPAICGLSTIGGSTIYGCGAYFTPAYIIKSTDGGNSWDYIDMASYANALVEIKFIDDNMGFVGGLNDKGACILKTIDGGLSWTEIYNSEIPGQYVWKFQLLQQNQDIIFGAVESISPHPGLLIKSIDGGQNWTSYNAPEIDIQAVGFIDENTGWMGGHNTGLYETTNGGETWTNLNIGSNLNRIFVLDQSKVFASGTSIYKYTDSSLGVEEHISAVSRSLKINFKNNPVKTDLKFSIEFAGTDNILMELYDINGKFIKKLLSDTIWDGQLTREYSFDVSNLSSGVYFLNLHNNYNRQSLKFIKG